MIDQAQAIKQLERLSGLDFFPKEKPARKELVLALQCAITDDIAAQVVSEWLAESNVCPKPAELRRLIYSRQEAILENLRKCHMCGGSGILTVWRLVTYRGTSWVVEKSQGLAMDWEQARQFSIDIQTAQEANPNLARQAVLSAAKSCDCRKALTRSD